MTTKAECFDCQTPLLRAGQKYCSRACRKSYEDKHFVRLCKTCNRTPEMTPFGFQAKSRDGLRSICMECTQTYAKKQYYSKDAIKLAARRKELNQLPQNQNTILVKKYGITYEAKQLLLDQQSNRCAICEVEFSPVNIPNVDHSHITSRVRGLLCRKCNLGLGAFYDSIGALQKVFDYLSLHPEHINEAMLWQVGETRLDFRPNRKLRLSQEGKLRLLAWQNNRCPICQKSPDGIKRFHLDHDHASGHIRGLLCGTCNIGLGQFRDNPALFEAAIAYLRLHTDNQGTTKYSQP